FLEKRGPQVESDPKLKIGDSGYYSNIRNPEQLNQIVIHQGVPARFTESDMFFRIHSSGDQRQKVRAVSSGPHTSAMVLQDHARVDVPTSECPGLDVLRTEGLGHVYCSLDVLWVCFWFDPASLFLIDGPITVKL